MSVGSFINIPGHSVPQPSDAPAAPAPVPAPDVDGDADDADDAQHNDDLVKS